MNKIILTVIFILLFTNTLFLQIHHRGKKMGVKITSAAFADSGMIPSKYTCDGINVSPPLAWQTEANGIKSFVLICDDPDAPAGDWVHWILYDLPAASREIKEDCNANRNLPDGALMGVNDFHKISYGGPCPPSGTHKYHFKIYALDKILHLNAGATKRTILEAMKGHVVDHGLLVGKYKRTK